MRFILAAALSLALSLTVGAAVAQDALAKPTGDVVLTVTGKISVKNNGDAADFDMAMLDKLPQATIVTVNDWVDKKHTYKGPIGSDLFKLLGATGTQLKVVALNDYVTTIPLEDFDKYGLILATSDDGQPMSVRDKGPIFVIYPFSDHPELEDQVFISRSAWQVRSIEVQ